MLSLGRFSHHHARGPRQRPAGGDHRRGARRHRLTGGRGSIIGTVVGVFIPAVLANGFIIMGIQPFWQMVVIGFVVIAAVYADQIKRQKSERL